MDAVWPDIWPKATDMPSPNLLTGGTVVDQEAQRCPIARYRKPSGNFQSVNINLPLPGTIDIGCGDGHGELAPLEKLWNYRWHLGYLPPTVRPGRFP